MGHLFYKHSTGLDVGEEQEMNLKHIDHVQGTNCEPTLHSLTYNLHSALGQTCYHLMKKTEKLTKASRRQSFRICAISPRVLTQLCTYHHVPLHFSREAGKQLFQSTAQHLRSRFGISPHRIILHKSFTSTTTLRRKLVSRSTKNSKKKLMPQV